MLSPDELASLESILERARASLATEPGLVIAPGDVVQLRPGADRAWDCSLLLVTQVRDGKVRGEILRPRRGGSLETASTYSLAEVTRVGRQPYPEPAIDVRSVAYDAPCEECVRKVLWTLGADAGKAREVAAAYRDRVLAMRQELL